MNNQLNKKMSELINAEDLPAPSSSSLFHVSSFGQSSSTNSYVMGMLNKSSQKEKKSSTLKENYESILNDLKTKNNSKRAQIEYYQIRVQWEKEFQNYVNKRTKIRSDHQKKDKKDIKVSLFNDNSKDNKSDYFPPLLSEDYDFLLTRKQKLFIASKKFESYIRDQKTNSKQLQATEIRTKQIIVK